MRRSAYAATKRANEKAHRQSQVSSQLADRHGSVHVRFDQLIDETQTPGRHPLSLNMLERQGIILQRAQLCIRRLVIAAQQLDVSRTASGRISTSGAC
jgi:hypothetical protein